MGSGCSSRHLLSSLSATVPEGRPSVGPPVRMTNSGEGMSKGVGVWRVGQGGCGFLRLYGGVFLSVSALSTLAVSSLSLSSVST